MKTNKLAKLLGTASVAAFAYAGALSAQEAIWDFADYGDTYENIVEQNYDDFDDIEIYSYNELGSEGALGATNTELEQVAVSQFVTFAGNTDSSHDTLIDQSHYIDEDADYYELSLGAYNQATAHTTSFDAMLGGSQIAMTSFNTAALDITTSGEDFDAEVALLQSLDGGTQDDYGYSVDFSAVNIMDAATAYAGTATIDSETFNADLNEGEGGYENGVQQAAISINTLSVDSEVDTFIELAGQNIDTDALTSAYDPVGPYSEGDSDFVAINVARAYAPVPATSEYVDPRLANDLNDPAVKNLDQVAAITINSMSFGNAADADEGIDASTANFDVLSYSNSGGEDAYGPGSTEGQYAEFDHYEDEITLDNIMVATTVEEVYTTFGGEDGAGLDWEAMEFLTEDDGIGQVAIENTSQVTALTINSINNAGDGALTLKETYAYGPSYTSADDSDFDQELQDLDYDAQIENLALAVTEVGDASASELVQVAQYSVNSIASGGDLNSWNEDGSDGIDQEVDDFHIERDEFFEGPELALNTVGVSTNVGNAEASNIDQRMQYSVNTISVGGDMTAGVDQDVDEIYVELDGYVNMIAVDSGDRGWSDDADTVSITDAQQVALFSINTVSVDGVLDTDYTDQHYDDAEDFEVGYDGTVNYATAYNDIGDASVSGLDQIAQLTFNSISADSLTGDDSDIHQDLDELDDMQNGSYAINEIDVEADYRGNAAIDSSSQAFILNANTIKIAGAVTGDLIEQDVSDIDLYDGDMATNTAYAWANDDVNGARWVGGNASITGLTQTLAMNFNSISAGSLEGVRIDQYAEEIDINVGNYAYADAELGAAVMTGVSQTTINRINTISITPPSLD